MTYPLVWVTGEVVYEGLGILQGDVLSAAWSESILPLRRGSTSQRQAGLRFGDRAQGTSSCGVVSYLVLEDGTLEGVWAIGQGGRTGAERAVRAGG